MEYDTKKLREAIMKKKNLDNEGYFNLLKRKASLLKKNKSNEKPIIAIAKQLKLNLSEFKI